ncbi:MAG: hypothetical protein VB111_00545 [Clostridiaceae bacterium]|nr:hypothetical protein [Clostridiaceae bacterium]
MDCRQRLLSDSTWRLFLLICCSRSAKHFYAACNDRNFHRSSRHVEFCNHITRSDKFFANHYRQNNCRDFDNHHHTRRDYYGCYNKDNFVDNCDNHSRDLCRAFL